MPPAQLKETTMDPAKRTLLKVVATPEERAATDRSGREPDGTAAGVALPVHSGTREDGRRGGRVSCGPGPDRTRPAECDRRSAETHPDAVTFPNDGDL